MKKKDLKPAGVFKYFEEICQVPRPSKKEEKMIAYLKAFGAKHNLETKVDEAGNVLIKKPATPGKENLQTVVLQSHIDMVCEKNNDVQHDFLTDPIETEIDGEWLKAKGTTLGADNGIGVATELAILADDSIEHGPLECLFTVDEETGLTGAFALQEGFMSGDILLNLDSEDEGEIFIGCAGGIDSVAEFTYKEVEIPAGYFFFKVEVKGLKGGHSGGDIHLGRGNANKILNRFLSRMAARHDLYLCEINGGNLRNAIPREAYTICAVPEDAKHDVRTELNIFTSEMEDELSVVEPDLKLVLESETPRKTVPGITFSSDIIVGFPGETEEDFVKTLELVRKVGYMQLFTFIYSKRTGTKAAEMPDPTPRKEKTDRMTRLLATQDEIAMALVKAQVGQTVRVLVEGYGRNEGTLSGRLDNNLTVEFAADPALLGSYATVHLTGARATVLLGEVEA